VVGGGSRVSLVPDVLSNERLCWTEVAVDVMRTVLAALVALAVARVDVQVVTARTAAFASGGRTVQEVGR